MQELGNHIFEQMSIDPISKQKSKDHTKTGHKARDQVEPKKPLKGNRASSCTVPAEKKRCGVGG
jgi:hypothetical protein